MREFTVIVEYSESGRNPCEWSNDMVQFSLPSAKNYMDCVAILEYCKQEVIEEKCGGIDALNRMIDLFCEKADASFKFVNNDYTITLPGEDEVEDE